MIRNIVLASIGSTALLRAMADEGAGGGGADKFEEDSGFLSLAALAGANTDEITALTSRVPPAGVWRVKGTEVKITQGEGKDGKSGPFNVQFIHHVAHGKATDPAYDNEKMVDRKLRQRFSIWPSDLEEGIGLLKGMYMKAGIEYTGTHMGGVENHPAGPGWVDNFVGAELDLRIRHGQRNGETIAYYDWLPVEEAEGEEA